MAARERPIDRGRRLARRAAVALGEELRNARIAAGVSQRRVAEAAGCSSSQVSRLERGLLRVVTFDLVARIAAVLGLDLSVRLFPEGDPIRDAAHAALLERFRRRLHPGLRWRAEVPIGQPGDSRAWDGHIDGRGFTLGVEGESRLHDLQAQSRRWNLKRRDGFVDHVIVLVADTRTNRAALAAGREAWRADLPLDGPEILAALAEGRDPGGSGIVRL